MPGGRSRTGRTHPPPIVPQQYTILIVAPAAPVPTGPLRVVLVARFGVVSCPLNRFSG